MRQKASPPKKRASSKPAVVEDRKPANAKSWSPNQLSKRDAIVEAAAQLLLREGVKGCSARAIAEESGITMSSLHYYFSDIDEIVDLAFRRATRNSYRGMFADAASETDPVDALWAAATIYLTQASSWDLLKESGKSSKKRAPMLWFEYHAESIRRGTMDTVREISLSGLKYFVDLVTATGVHDPADRADALYSALLGYSIRDSIAHREPKVVLGLLGRLMGLPTSAKYCA